MIKIQQIFDLNYGVRKSKSAKNTLDDYHFMVRLDGEFLRLYLRNVKTPQIFDNDKFCSASYNLPKNLAAQVERMTMNVQVPNPGNIAKHGTNIV